MTAPGGLRVRPATPADAAAVAQLATVLGTALEAEAVGRRLAALPGGPGDEGDEGHTVLVAEQDGRVVGWVHALLAHRLTADAFAEVVGLAVEPAARRRGVGHALVAAAGDRLRARGASGLRVRHDVRRAEAGAFYERLGFRTRKSQHVLERPLPLEPRVG